jgi:hypothetical protein
MSGKIGEINSRTEKVFNGISEIEIACQSASNNIPSASLIEKANQLKSEGAEIQQIADELTRI